MGQTVKLNVGLTGTECGTESETDCGTAHT